MKTIKLPFGWKLYVMICSFADLEKESKKIGVKFDFGEDNHKTNGFSEFIKRPSPKTDLFTIWVKPEYPECNYLLTHEIHHTVKEYCLHLGIKDFEFEAYLYENICRQLKIFSHNAEMERSE